MAMTPEQRKKMLEDLYTQYTTTEDIIALEQRLAGILEKQNSSLASYLSSQKEIQRKVNEQNKARESLVELETKVKSLLTLQNELRGKEKKEVQGKIKALQNIIAQTEKTLQLNQQEIAALSQNLSLTKAIGNEIGKGAKSLFDQHFTYRGIWDYLQKVDNGIRSTQLNLGLSGNKAEFLREQMEEATNTAQRFGAGIDDVVELQSGLNQLTGRAGVLTEHQIANMVAITKGTGMANQEATNLVGNMMLFGSSIEDSKKLIEGTVNSTAQLGLNSSNVLKGMSTNIGKLNNYRFQNGVEGLKKMVQASEKFKFSMEGAFAAAEKFRTLEGLLQAGAELRVLGGEFAKIDEFKFSFLARNKPEEFAIEMAKLTKGMASFNKETGMFDISDVDMDRLRAVAESTGRSLDDVVQTTREFNKQEFAKKQIFVGTPEEKEMLAKLAQFGKGSTIGTIQIGDKNVKLSELTREQIDLYKQQQKTLEERAVDSQNFDKAFTNTIMQLKSTLIPLLTVINSLLEGFNSVFNMARDENGKMNKLAAIIPIGGLLLGGVGIKAIGGLFSGIFSGISGVLGKIGGALSSKLGLPGPQLGPALPGGGMFGGMGAASIAAMGVAALGVGAGFMLAAKGATSLAEAMSKLKPEQVSGLTTALITLGLAMVGIVAIAPAIGMAAPELLAFGAAVTLIGAGVGIAAAGIGELVKAFNSENMNFSGLEGVDFNNIDKLKILQNFKQSDVDRMNEIFDVLNKINSIDTAKINSLEKLFANASFKVTLDGDAVLKNTINIDIAGEKITKLIDERVKVVTRKQNAPK
jgi:hypothetical protein